MSKYYAVKKGRNCGIYNSWVECEKQVKGYSNAQFKSFSSLKDARNYIEDTHNETEGLIAYVDGSYNNSKKIYGYGCALIYNGKLIEQLSGSGNNEKHVSMRNVAGELQGVLAALKYATSNNYKNIIIYYDYMGIEKWANKQWQANKLGTQYYSKMIDEYRKSIDIKFIKVEAHSGDYYNEMADKLAKKAVGIIE